MMVYLCVEGDSDCKGLDSLLADYRALCGRSGWGIQCSNRRSKSQLLEKIGNYALARLSSEPQSHVIAMPDVYPVQGFGASYVHNSYETLCTLLVRLVSQHCEGDPNILSRFHAHPFRHDMEVLLLAASQQLRSYLHTNDRLTTLYRHPAEDQNNDEPPKRKVEQIFRTRHAKKYAYQDTIHAPAILRNVNPADLKASADLPRFSAFLSDLEAITGVPL